MSTESDYGLTPAQYHAGLDKLWTALENVKYNGERDVFTMCADRIKELESALAETFEQVYDNPHIDGLIERVLPYG